ncbi:DUF202 domain-containing protein [Nocardia abscessus]|uniref:DUF202 domain-containing protein n=1 Tax=Nocardia abscessus TaxID=120957 RepID=UPI002458E101|nr:DUF202 domain-containing protein [Nocardia abscessus]
MSAPHLSAERTALAWRRTAVAAMVVGTLFLHQALESGWRAAPAAPLGAPGARPPPPPGPAPARPAGRGGGGGGGGRPPPPPPAPSNRCPEPGSGPAWLVETTGGRQ